MQQLTHFNEHIRSNEIRSNVEKRLNPRTLKRSERRLASDNDKSIRFPTKNQQETSDPQVDSQKSRDKAPTRPENGPPSSDQGFKSSHTGRDHVLPLAPILNLDLSPCSPSDQLRQIDQLGPRSR